MASIGQLIKIGRINKSLSQEDVASKLKVTKNYISLVENNKKDPSINFLKKISKLLDIPVILLIWEKIDLPKGKTESEKKILSQLENMIENAQKIFADESFKTKR
ncbi:MAG: helix-turn-helix transcriptional regulator [Bacilli bacterium]|nr:helix-turn-helix domain-containing protein [Patescibacteria group bacterium]